MDSEFIQANNLIKNNVEPQTSVEDQVVMKKPRGYKKPDWRKSKYAGFIQKALEGNENVLVEDPRNRTPIVVNNLNGILKRNKLNLICLQVDKKPMLMKQDGNN